MSAGMIIVGIPSWNEAATIGHVVTAVDAGLARLGLTSDALIVNADNNSPDGTRAIFEATPTATAKSYLSTPENVRGKGNNIANLVREAVRRDARALVLVDADLKSIDSGWVPRLLRPVLDDGADFVSPRYVTSQGGPLRNLICRPLVAGLFAADVEQPTGGEFALSGALLRHLEQEPLPPAAESYGIDIFLTTEAAVQGCRLATADLGRKDHRPRRWDSITPIAVEVVRTLFEQVARHHEALARRSSMTRPTAPGPAPAPTGRPAPTRIVSEAEIAGLLDQYRRGLAEFAEVYLSALDSALAARMLAPAPDGVPRDLWRPLLYGLTRHAAAHPDARDRCAAALMPLFQGRMVTFAAELAGGTDPLPSTEINSYFDGRRSVFDFLARSSEVNGERV